MSPNNDPVIEGKSLEKLEDEIAAIYQEAHRVNPYVKVQETGILADLWAEFDRRSAAGEVDDD